MPTEMILCPSCKAADTSITDANGINQCVFCGVRYRIKATARGHAGPPPQMIMVADPRSGSSSTNVAVVVAAAAAGVMMLGGVLAGLVFYVNASDVPPPPEEVVAVSSPPSIVETTPERPSAPTTSTLRSTQKLPAGPVSAKFEYHRTIKTSIGSQYVLGVVTNTSEAVLGKSKVNVVLLDGDGKELGVERGYTTRDRIGPGERSPVKILLKDPPDYKELKYEVVAREPMGATRFVEGLRVEAGEPRSQFGNFWKVDGKVFNEGEQAARFVRIETTAYDAERKILGVHTTYADSKRLEPGATSRFSNLGMQLDEAPHHFEYQVVGQLAP